MIRRIQIVLQNFIISHNHEKSSQIASKQCQREYTEIDVE